MELADNFGDQWTKGDATNIEGYNEFRIMKSGPNGGAGQFWYACFDMDGNLHKYNLSGGRGKRDPLNGVSLANIKLGGDGKQIAGIIIEDECMLYKG